MDSRRQSKIASVIKEAFTDILSREGKSIYGKAFVTVTNVKVTSDLTLVRFYLSIYNAENPDEVVNRFNESKFEIKRHLAEKLRHQLRRIPEIEFFRDDTLDYVSRMEEVFKKINAEEQELKNSLQAKKPAAKSKAAVRKKSK
jgi:ribosome-binding factor A